jgi:ABC-type polysaccharide/polyol phosphate transport system ATPase subunit
MHNIAIRVEKLGKKYQIGSRIKLYKTLQERLLRTLASPFQYIWNRVVRGIVTDESDTTIWALRNLSFEIKKGAVVGIIGRNGTGKSTLLKILSRITEPTEGVVDIYGRVGSMLEVGIGFHPELTGRENIYLNGAILGMRKKEIESKLDEIIAFAEVEKFIDTPLKRYSSGMYMRLAFAVAAHIELEILLVDEVLSVGDMNFQQKCIRAMHNISQKGRTILLVSHDMRVVETLANQCLYLKKLEEAKYGSTTDMIREYQKDLSSGAFLQDLPSQLTVDIVNPKIAIHHLTWYSKDCQREAVKTGTPVQVLFTLEAIASVTHIVVCVAFCKDKIIVAESKSHPTLENVSLQPGQKVNLEIRYESLPFTHGEYIVVVFVLPSSSSSPTESLSPFHCLKMLIEGTGSYTDGYIVLQQQWDMREEND